MLTKTPQRGDRVVVIAEGSKHRGLEGIVVGVTPSKRSVRVQQGQRKPVTVRVTSVKRVESPREPLAEAEAAKEVAEQLVRLVRAVERYLAAKSA